MYALLCVINTFRMHCENQSDMTCYQYFCQSCHANCIIYIIHHTVNYYSTTILLILNDRQDDVIKKQQVNTPSYGLKLKPRLMMSSFPSLHHNFSLSIHRFFHFSQEKKSVPVTLFWFLHFHSGSIESFVQRQVDGKAVYNSQDKKPVLRQWMRIL